jgi:hypothetical protein
MRILRLPQRLTTPNRGVDLYDAYFRHSRRFWRPLSCVKIFIITMRTITSLARDRMRAYLWGNSKWRALI